MRVENTIEIDAPVSVVWKHTVDIEAWPSTTPTVTEVERLDTGPLAVGSRARLKQPGQRARVWTVSELEPERRFAWSARLMGMTMDASHELDESPTGCSNTVAVEITGPLAPILGPLMRRPISKALATENEGFDRVSRGESP